MNETEVDKRPYARPRAELVSCPVPQNLLSSLSYPGMVDTDFEDLVEGDEWL